MNQFASLQHTRSHRLALLALVSLPLVTACAPHAVQPDRQVSLIHQASPELPEQRNQSAYAEPVTETEVVRVYGYPTVDEFESQPL